MTNGDELDLLNETLFLCKDQTADEADALLEDTVARAAHRLHLTITVADRRVVAALAYEQLAAL
jgi:hypothetical protein